MSEAVKVVVRCRPMNRREIDLSCENVVAMHQDSLQCAIINPAEPKATPKAFTFDGVYGPDSITESLYNDVAYPLVEATTNGFNSTCFAYGQTGCGKSFTMQGIPDNAPQRGIIPRAFEHIFESISLAPDSKFLVAVSYLEIYNEEIRDLLQTSDSKLEMKEHPDKGVFVAGLSLRTVKSAKECEQWLDKGAYHRHTGATLMNADSSRSHSVFCCQVEAIDNDPATGKERLRVGKLNLVDLAGSERQSKTGATGDRLKEATKINLSLSALGNVISALVDGKSKHIPYRDSKLTRLLQDSLGGNTKTLMVACISPADNNYDESLSTLRYANRAKNIQNKPRVNEDPKDALLREYQDEIKRLKAMLEGRPLDDVAPARDNRAGKKVQEQQGGMEHEETIRELMQQMEEMKRKHDEDRNNLQGEIARLQTLAIPQPVLDTGFVAEGGDQEATAPRRRRRRQQQEQEDGEDGGRDAGVGTETAAGPEGEEVGNAARQQQFLEVDPDTGDPLKMLPSQYAIHLQTVALPPGQILAAPNNQGLVGSGEAAGLGASVSQPSQSDAVDFDVNLEIERELAFRKLEELQNQMAIVGGEAKGNVELQKKHDKRGKAAEARRQKIAEQLANATDDDILIDIIEGIQNDVRKKEKTIVKGGNSIEALQHEIGDLQAEFERERSDFLDTIRKNEREIAFLSSLTTKMQTLIRRDCNYYNVDRIRAQSRWNDDEQVWQLPSVMVPGGGEAATRRSTAAHSPPDSVALGTSPTTAPFATAAQRRAGTGSQAGPLPGMLNTEQFDDGSPYADVDEDDDYRRRLEERIAAENTYSERWKISKRREAILQEARATQQLIGNEDDLLRYGNRGSNRLTPLAAPMPPMSRGTAPPPPSAQQRPIMGSRAPNRRL